MTLHAPLSQNDALINLLATRRSSPPAALLAPGPTPEELQTLLKLAARVPDHGKLVPWRFVVFEGEARERAGALFQGIFATDNADATRDRLGIEAMRFCHAPMVIAVVSRAAPHVKIPEWEQVLSAGAVCMNLAVAARAMGFSTAWLTDWMAYDRRVLTGLGLAAHENVAGFVHIGRASTVPEDRVRPEIAAITTYF